MMNYVSSRSNVSPHTRAAYQYAIYIENRFLRFDRYIVSEVSV